MSSIPKQNLPVSCEISSKYLEISFFSCTNLTFESVSAESSIAWLKPFSPPYDTSTVFMILATRRWSKMSEPARSFLKSAEPARTIPVTFTLSAEMNIWADTSATLRT